MAAGTFDLAIKRAPRQKRAVETYERILDVSTRLLTDVGFESMTTNLIAAKAGIKVPTLYRYFPNKYAVMMELGNRLMQAQNVIIEQWLDRAEANREPGALIDDIEFLIAGTIRVTRAEHGALAISLALRAVPALQEVRLSSHRKMTDVVTDRIGTRLAGIGRDLLWPRIRLSLDLVYAAVEMALEEPRVDDELIATETTRQVRAYWTAQLALWLKE
mgnify:CR=1 FL=1|tara:strand:+ start:524 stop:1174 length:651 start_codon:yes stop_codon:yes gene_type:complete